MTDVRLEPGPVAQMERMLAGHFVAQILHVAAVLGIADHISAGRTTLDQIATATSTRTQFLDRLLLVLASLGAILKTSDGDFTLTPLGETLKTDSPVSLRDKAIFEASAPIWDAMAGLVDEVCEGSQPFSTLHKGSLYQYLARNSDLASVFNRFMTAQSKLHNMAIVEAYDFTGLRTMTPCCPRPTSRIRTGLRTSL